MKKITVIIPFYNEEGNLVKICGELQTVFDSTLKNYELETILMDNHSTDSSFQVACALVSKHKGWKVIRLSRNFGYQANIWTGYLAASGDAAIQLDADGEDDPQHILKFIDAWLAGNEVVYGVREGRQESFVMQLQRKIFYRLLAMLSSVPIPVDAGDFRLLDRKVIEALKKFPESNIYLRGMVSYIGFNQFGIPYVRRKRFDGKSKFSWWQYFTLAIDGITSFSKRPLGFITWLGFSFSILSFLGAIFYIIFHFFIGTKLPGFTTIVLIQLFLAGIQLVCVGTLGSYVGRIFDEVKDRPKSIVEKVFTGDQP